MRWSFMMKSGEVGRFCFHGESLYSFDLIIQPNNRPKNTRGNLFLLNGTLKACAVWASICATSILPHFLCDCGVNLFRRSVISLYASLSNKLFILIYN